MAVVTLQTPLPYGVGHHDSRGARVSAMAVRVAQLSSLLDV
jgi:hypothetical protein